MSRNSCTQPDCNEYGFHDASEAFSGLLKKIGADVVAACFVIDLPDLGGAQKITALGVPVQTPMSFEGH
jgi:adenine phosphoribosyltransferase